MSGECDFCGEDSFSCLCTKAEQAASLLKQLKTQLQEMDLSPEVVHLIFALGYGELLAINVATYPPEKRQLVIDSAHQALLLQVNTLLPGIEEFIRKENEMDHR